MADRNFSVDPANTAERVAELVAQRAFELGADIVAVVVRVPGGRPDVGTCLSADDPKQARRLLLESAAVVATGANFPGGV